MVVPARLRDVQPMLCQRGQLSLVSTYRNGPRVQLTAYNDKVVCVGHEHLSCGWRQKWEV